MVALDGATLAVKSPWTLPQSHTVSDSDWGNTPILFADSANNALVAATNKNGYGYAFDRANVGNGPVWSTQIANGGSTPQNGDGSVSSGAFGNGMLFMAGGHPTINGTSYNGSVRALNPGTGAVLWAARRTRYGASGAGLRQRPRGGRRRLDGGGTGRRQRERALPAHRGRRAVRGADEAGTRAQVACLKSPVDQRQSSVLRTVRLAPREESSRRPGNSHLGHLGRRE